MTTFPSSILRLTRIKSRSLRENLLGGLRTTIVVPVGRMVKVQSLHGKRRRATKAKIPTRASSLGSSAGQADFLWAAAAIVGD